MGIVIRVPIPVKDVSRCLPNGQFLDYTQSYIPYLAEYECVLRIGDGEVYAGNDFNESQIRLNKYIRRPNDDFVDGLGKRDVVVYRLYHCVIFVLFHFHSQLFKMMADEM